MSIWMDEICYSLWIWGRLQAVRVIGLMKVLSFLIVLSEVSFMFDLFSMSDAFLHFSDLENALLPYALGLVYGAIALWVRAEAGSREYVKPVVAVSEEIGEAEVEIPVDAELAVFVAEYEAADKVLGEPISLMFNPPPLSRVDAADAAVMQNVVKKNKSRSVVSLIKDLWEEGDEGNRLETEQTGDVVKYSDLEDFDARETEWGDYRSHPSE
jgi:hypothetical protein